MADAGDRPGDCRAMVRAGFRRRAQQRLGNRLCPGEFRPFHARQPGRDAAKLASDLLYCAAPARRRDAADEIFVPALALAFTRSGFAPPIRKPMLFQLAMVAAVVLLFSVSSAKRDDYILPALPPLAILFATLFTNLPAAAGGSSRSASRVRNIRSRRSRRRCSWL